jgi:hypothetical protein
VESPSPAADSKANGVIQASVVLQLVMTGLHALLVFSVLANVLLDVAGAHPRGAHGSSPYEQGRVFGRYLAMGLAALWAAVGLAWTPINAWGLQHRAPWARTSTLVYWSISMITFCCSPFGAFGIYLMTRPGVKDQFQR